MDIKYYDLLSTTIIGVTIVAAINYLFLENIEIDGIVYLALGYLAGYLLMLSEACLKVFTTKQ